MCLRQVYHCSKLRTSAGLLPKDCAITLTTREYLRCHPEPREVDMRHRRFGGMVVLFACILAGSPLGFAGQETIRVQPDDDQSEFIQLAQASGSVDMPSSGMGAGGARPPSRINPPHQIQPPMNGGGFGMGGRGRAWVASQPTLLAQTAGLQLECVRGESGALLGSHAIAREFLMVDLTLDRLSGDLWRRVTISRWPVRPPRYDRPAEPGDHGPSPDA